MEYQQGPFGPSHFNPNRGAGSGAAWRLGGRDWTGRAWDRLLRLVIIVLVLGTNLVLAVRGEDLATVIGFSATELVSAAGLVRLLAGGAR